MKRVIVLAALLALVGAAALAAAPTTGELLRWVPAGAEVVVAMDAAALREHPLVQSWLLEHQSAWSGHDASAREFLADAGLDPLKDVDRMVVAIVPQAGADRGLAAFGGRFDPVSLAAALTKRGSEPVAIGAATALRLQDAQHPNPAAPLVFITQDVVVAADEATLRAVLAAAPPASALVGAEVAAGRLDLGAPFWLVAAVPDEVRSRAAAPDGATSDGAAEAIRGIVMASRAVRRVTMQASLGDELTLVGSAVADTAENADLLRDALKGAIAAVRLQVQGDSPELVEVLRDITVRTEGSEVRAAAAIPVALVEKLARSHARPCEASAPPAI